MSEFQNIRPISELAKEHPLLLVQFGSAACTPCTALRQKLELWCSQRDYADLLYVSLDCFPETAAQLGVFSVPTIFLYVEGALTLRESGYFSLEELLRKAERYHTLLTEG